MSARNWVQDMPTEEAYAINRILYRVQHDRAEEARFFESPSRYIAEEPLSEAARAALDTTDIGQLYLLGANPYLLRAYCLQLRIPEADYLAALRAAGDASHG
ncbi:hypothetical protein [Novosphingobium humi]|uniref:Extradiol ring-cleavage dioxygenase LigAB LigA subunit domain-containing protein n=1 Tax=Novosphingobium humi TaxID=2282397 RepID=A0ABY7U129_9SPHN|nr:hypothetical protein [Novosphingobium humi]WCT79232.1 hypothetical protein PQ457_19720 [Novosphingobium humi]